MSRSPAQADTQIKDFTDRVSELRTNLHKLRPFSVSGIRPGVPVQLQFGGG
jgi:hypothetical protein